MSAPVQSRRRRHVPVWERRGLTARARRLLLDGDVNGRYVGHNDPDTGYRLTMALALACSQPGRRWTPADFHHALIYTPTAGGWWARKLRERKGSLYAENKLTEMLDKAADFAAANEPITGRQDAVEKVEEFRRIVESLTWPTRDGGATDHKNLAARLRLCERSGGLDHTIALRPLAEQMGCSRSTVEASNARLRKAGWLTLDTPGTGKNHGSQWRLKVPKTIRDRITAGAAPGQFLPPTTKVMATVPDPHTFTDTFVLAEVMAHDAFHHWAHGTSGARLLACLDPVEGLSPDQLQQATTLHRTTIKRRMTSLVDDGLAEEREGLYYLSIELAGDVRLDADDQVLEQAAENHGTHGRGATRQQRHARERSNFQRWLAERPVRRQPARPPLVVVPEGVVDPHTGELLDDRWRGWDCSDPARSVWCGDLRPVRQDSSTLEQAA